MAEERSVDKLARYTMWAVVAAIIIALCWYFRNVLIYIIMAAVVSLMGRPLMKLMQRIRIKGHSAPAWLLSIISIILLLLIFFGIITQIFPVVISIVQNISSNLQQAQINTSNFTGWLDSANQWLAQKFPRLGKDFKLQETIVGWIQKAYNIKSLSSLGSMVGSVAAALAAFGMGIFCTMFIAFFFIKDDKLFGNIVGSLVPDKAEAQVKAAIGDIEYLLSRYFVGLFLEVLGVTLLNFIGLLLVAKLGFSAAIGIGFMTGILNIIPYLGPWIGGAIGVILGLVLKYSSAAVVGVYPNFWVVIITLIAIFAITQMIDNFLLQPFIYSASIKSTPLEIFLVLIVAGNIGGMLGMLVAIPAYTVLRVIAARFFYKFKPVRRLIDSSSGANKKKPN
jgi:predicted PurR-regulated permease PerM